MAKPGRPTNEVRLAARMTAKEILDGQDQSRMWAKYLDSEDERISLDAWKYLNDRVHGKPAQAVDVKASVNAKITFSDIVTASWRAE